MNGRAGLERADVEHAGHVLALQANRRARLAKKTLLESSFASTCGSTNLSADLLLEREVRRRDDHAHAADAEHALDAVFSGDHVAYVDGTFLIALGHGVRETKGSIIRCAAACRQAGSASGQRSRHACGEVGARIHRVLRVEARAKLLAIPLARDGYEKWLARRRRRHEGAGHVRAGGRGWKGAHWQKTATLPGLPSARPPSKSFRSSSGP